MYRSTSIGCCSAASALVPAEAYRLISAHASIAGVALEAGCIARARGDFEAAMGHVEAAGSVVDQLDLLVQLGRLDEARALFPSHPSIFDR